MNGPTKKDWEESIARAHQALSRSRAPGSDETESEDGVVPITVVDVSGGLQIAVGETLIGHPVPTRHQAQALFQLVIEALRAYEGVRDR